MLKRLVQSIQELQAQVKRYVDRPNRTYRQDYPPRR